MDVDEHDAIIAVENQQTRQKDHTVSSLAHAINKATADNTVCAIQYIWLY
jgi:hypothetical protein